jgi:hypothetical protein
MTANIVVIHGQKAYLPPVEEGITVSFERKGSPGQMTFSIAKCNGLELAEGDSVKLQVDGKDFFAGFLFTRKYSGQGDTVQCTCYDQLRYFKNKATYVYTNKTAADVLRMISQDFGLKTGMIDQTAYTIPQKVEDDQTLFDIVQSALDETLTNRKKMYVLYDDCGKLCLKDVESMLLPILFDGYVMGDYDYTASIDQNVYNQVTVYQEDKEQGSRTQQNAQDAENIRKWGILRLTDKAQTAATSAMKANALLSLYNRERRTLDLKDVLGDTRVRAGSSVVVKLTEDDLNLQNFMLVESVRHEFTQNQHMMSMKLRGGVITG